MLKSFKFKSITTFIFFTLLLSVLSISVSCTNATQKTDASNVISNDTFSNNSNENSKDTKHPQKGFKNKTKNVENCSFDDWLNGKTLCKCDGLLIDTTIEQNESTITKELKPYNDLITQLQKEKKLPEYIPYKKDMPSTMDYFYLKKLELKPACLIKTELDSVSLRGSPRKFAALIANNKDGSLISSYNNTILIGSDGDDEFSNAHSQEIIAPRKGNDFIHTGRKSDIIIFEKDWGHDTIYKTCSDSEYDSDKTYKSNEIGYKWKYNNFIIFGKGINEKDMVWKNKVLLNRKTKDSILFNSHSKCFNFVYLED